MTGNGYFAIDVLTGRNLGEQVYDPTLDLMGAQTQNVIFREGIGILQLDDPADCTGKIGALSPANAHVSQSNMRIELEGVNIGSVTGYDYNGDDFSGTLVIHTTSRDYSYGFLGEYQESDFQLSAGPQAGSPANPVLDIAVTPQASPPFILNVPAPQVAIGTTPVTPFPAVTILAHVDNFEQSDLIVLAITESDPKSRRPQFARALQRRRPEPSIQRCDGATVDASVR